MNRNVISWSLKAIILSSLALFTASCFQEQDQYSPEDQAQLQRQGKGWISFLAQASVQDALTGFTVHITSSTDGKVIKEVVPFTTTSGKHPSAKKVIELDPGEYKVKAVPEPAVNGCDPSEEKTVVVKVGETAVVQLRSQCAGSVSFAPSTNNVGPSTSNGKGSMDVAVNTNHQPRITELKVPNSGSACMPVEITVEWQDVDDDSLTYEFSKSKITTRCSTVPVPSEETQDPDPGSGNNQTTNPPTPEPPQVSSCELTLDHLSDIASGITATFKAPAGKYLIGVRASDLYGGKSEWVYSTIDIW